VIFEAAVKINNPKVNRYKIMFALDIPNNNNNNKKKD
jgi:hypothetical protein